MLVGLWSLLIVFVVIPAAAFAAHDIVSSLDRDMASLRAEIKAAQRSLAKSGPRVKPPRSRGREVKPRMARPGTKPQMARPTVKPRKRELPLSVGKMHKQVNSLSRTVSEAAKTCRPCKAPRQLTRNIKDLDVSVDALVQAKKVGDKRRAEKILRGMSATLVRMKRPVKLLASEMKKQLKPGLARPPIGQKPGRQPMKPGRPGVGKKPVVSSSNIRDLHLKVGKTSKIVLKGKNLDQFVRARVILDNKPAKDIDVRIRSKSKKSLELIIRVKAKAQAGAYQLQLANSNAELMVVPQVNMIWRPLFDAGTSADPTKIESAFFTPSEIKSGESTTLTIVLDHPAKDSGEIIEIARDRYDLWERLPERATVPAGKRRASVSLTTNGSRQSTPATQGYAVTLDYKGKLMAPSVRVTDIQPPPSDPCNSYTFTVNPNSVNAGGEAIGTIELGCPAPAGGAEVGIAVPGFPSSIQSIPDKIVVPAGQKEKTFAIATNPSFTMDVTAVIEARYRGPHQTARLNIRCAKVASVTLPSDTIVGGQSMTGTVTLDKEAPPGGFTVRLERDVDSDSPPHLLKVAPENLLIPAGQREGSFTITTKEVDKHYGYGIHAWGNGYAYNHVSLWPVVGVTALTTYRPGEPDLHPPPADGRNGATVPVYVNLNYMPPKAGFTVNLSKGSNDAEMLKAVSIPSTFTVPHPKRFAAFEAITTPVSKEGGVWITARGVSTVIRFALPPPLSGIHSDFPSITGGSTIRASVWLSKVSEVGAIDINLSSSDPTVARVPATVTVPGTGNTPDWGFFHIETMRVPNSKTVTITATDGKVTKTLKLTVSPGS